MSETYSGGCQCGRVRYQTERKPENAHLCHCRMCQKAVGNYFATLGSVPLSAFSLTRGEPDWFYSSDAVRRGFCSACGTPLFFQAVGGDYMAIMLGSLDHPESVEPIWQSDGASAMPWLDALFAKPGKSDADVEGEQEGRRKIALTNHQHPDHDTVDWPDLSKETP